VSVRWNSKKVFEAFSLKTACLDGDLLKRASVAAKRAEGAAGVRSVSTQNSDLAVDAGVERSRAKAGGQAPPSVRVMSLLGRMKQLAVRGFSRELSGSEREVMGQEFARLSGQIDRISEEISRVVPRGDIPTNYDSVEAFFESVFADETLDGLLDPFSSFSLGVDVDSVHLKTPGSAKIALDAIDDAVNEMQRIHRDGASTEAHLDAALERLSAFVESIDPDAVVPRDPDAAVEAAELVRLHLMNGRGVSSAGQSKNLQLSVTALLQ
jgi:hypothetical protein